MTHVSPSDRFITFTETLSDDGTTRDMPLLVLNPRAISSLRLSEETEDGKMSLLVRQLNGDHFSLGPMPRLRARTTLRELLVGLGEKTSVVLPEGASLSQEA